MHLKFYPWLRLLGKAFRSPSCPLDLPHAQHCKTPVLLLSIAKQCNLSCCGILLTSAVQYWSLNLWDLGGMLPPWTHTRTRVKFSAHHWVHAQLLHKSSYLAEKKPEADFYIAGTFGIEAPPTGVVSKQSLWAFLGSQPAVDIWRQNPELQLIHSKPWVPSLNGICFPSEAFDLKLSL